MSLIIFLCWKQSQLVLFNPLHAVGTFMHQDRSNSAPIILFLTCKLLIFLNYVQDLAKLGDFINPLCINPLRAELFQLQF